MFAKFFMVFLDGTVAAPPKGKTEEYLRDLTEPGATTLSLGPSEGAAKVGVLCPPDVSEGKTVSSLQSPLLSVLDWSVTFYLAFAVLMAN